MGIFDNARTSIQERVNSIFTSPDKQQQLLEHQEKQKQIRLKHYADNDEQSERNKEYFAMKKKSHQQKTKQNRKPQMMCIDLCGLPTNVAILEIRRAIIVHGCKANQEDSNSQRANIIILSFILFPDFTRDPSVKAICDAIERYLQSNHFAYSVPISHGMISVIINV